ncbi:hypothetical protein EV379_1226 [Microterricola gilva]|uniref:Uncharacterized protein n=1 Tax=Microterricola gilva TaxID=393267 RepID=A0A4Q8ALZ6_9MICO|nr:hypothetical protein EV379_1226 [Microterricola gilva]
MTRMHVTSPVWAWCCDECGRTDHRLEFAQSKLPKPEQMTREGWFIAKLWGDKCPDCNAKPTTFEALPAQAVRASTVSKEGT